MKIAYSWLKDYIDIDLSSEEVSDILTNTGLEVDELESVETVEGGLKGLLVGEVKEVSPHPNADKLKLTKVDVGKEDHLNIICGAPNVAEGQKVVVAPVGTVLHPKGHEPLKIKKAKMRGEVSEGMICAEDEIGLGNDHDGILVLDDTAEVGKPVREHFNVKEDHVFDIDITPNRPDATSYIGVARDLYAALRYKGKDIELDHPSVDGFEVTDTSLPIEVEVRDPEACPRYSGLTISGIQVGPSPQWLQDRLKLIGLNPINNVVDVTNFVLFELGQPLHAFDAEKIKGNRVVVSKLEKGTKFKTLDEEERVLSNEDLMICNEEEGMCIAGVFGGIDSGVTEQTKSIFLESAYFDPSSIRRTAKRHGLSTDASFRFERGVDPNITVYALKRAALLIREVAGGKVSSGIVDHYPNPIEDHSVRISFERIGNLIGESISPDRIKDILGSLDIGIEKSDDEGMTLSVPPYRVDVQREADIVEEILRIHGYDSIHIPGELHSTVSYSEPFDRDLARRKVSDLLASRGFNEILTNSLVNSAYTSGKGSAGVDPERNIEVLNPISSDLDVLRQTMVHSGLEAVAWNVNRKNPDLRFFEFGKTYVKGNKGSKYIENEHFVIFMTGRGYPENWRNPSEEISFFDIKGVVNSILERIGVLDQMEISEPVGGFIDEGSRYGLKGKPAAEFGRIDDQVLKRMDVDQEVFFADIDWSVLLEAMENSKVQFTPIPKYPPVRRDLSLILDKSVPFSKVRELAFSSEKKYLQEVDLFDVFEGEKIGKGKKSYAVKFILQDPEKTLKDKEIDKAMDRVLKRLRTDLGAKLRDA